jgi:cytoskeletal protein CcmA (bactofilin family)
MQHKSQKIAILALVITLAFALVVVPTSRAQGIIYGNTIPAGQTVENNVILAGDTVKIEGTVDGDVIALGTDVQVDGSINGSLVTAGETVTINGSVDGSVYTSALSVEMGEESAIGHDLYLLGGQLVTKPGSAIGRDILAITVGATLNGEVSRDVRAIIGPVEIVNAILQLTQGKSLRDFLPSRLRSALPPGLAADAFSGTVNQAGLGLNFSRHPQMFSKMDTLHPENLDVPSSPVPTGGGIDWNQVGNWGLNRLRHLVVAYIFGALVLLIFPRRFKGWTEKAASSPLHAAAWGLVVIIIGFSLALLIAVLILPIAIFFFSLTLNSLGAITLSLGYFGLGLALTVFIIFAFYVSKVVVAYMVAKLILDRLIPRVAGYRFLVLLLGVFLFVLVVSIPYIGWIINFVIALIGAGAIWMRLQVKEKEEPASEVPIETATA